MIRVGDTGSVQGREYLPPPQVRLNAMVAHTAGGLAAAAPTGAVAGAQGGPPQLTPQQQNALWLSRLAADAAQLYQDWNNPTEQAQLFNDIKMIQANCQDPTVLSFCKQVLSVQGQPFSAMQALWVTGSGGAPALSSQIVNIFANAQSYSQEFALSYQNLTPDACMNVYMFVINMLSVPSSNINITQLDSVFFGAGGNGNPGMMATTFGQFAYTYFIELNTQNGVFNAAGFQNDVENFEASLVSATKNIKNIQQDCPNFYAALYGCTLGGTNYPGFYGMGDDSIFAGFLSNASTYWPPSYSPFGRPSLQESDTLPPPWWDNPVFNGQYNPPSQDPFYVFAANNAWYQYFNAWPPQS